MMQVEMSTDFCTIFGKDSASYTILNRNLLTLLILLSLSKINYVYDH
jgi:hypothetical protein